MRVRQLGDEFRAPNSDHNLGPASNHPLRPHDECAHLIHFVPLLFLKHHHLRRYLLNYAGRDIVRIVRHLLHRAGLRGV